MIKQDKILAEARLIEAEFKKLRSTIFKMCEDMDLEEDVKKKEIILKAISDSYNILVDLKQKHEEKLNEAK